MRFIANVLVLACVNLVHGFYVMVGVGIIHAEWIHQMPTIGYWWAVILVSLLRGIFTPIDWRRSEP